MEAPAGASEPTQGVDPVSKNLQPDQPDPRPQPEPIPDWVERAIASVVTHEYAPAVGVITSLMNPENGLSDAERVASTRAVLAATSTARAARESVTR